MAVCLWCLEAGHAIADCPLRPVAQAVTPSDALIDARPPLGRRYITAVELAAVLAAYSHRFGCDALTVAGALVLVGGVLKQIDDAPAPPSEVASAGVGA
jgi:hypothetical protein